MAEKTFKVEGMSCGHCKAAFEEEPGKFEGVEHSNADPGKGIVEVCYDEGKVTDDDISDAVEEAGCTVATCHRLSARGYREGYNGTESYCILFCVYGGIPKRWPNTGI